MPCRDFGTNPKVFLLIFRMEWLSFTMTIRPRQSPQTVSPGFSTGGGIPGCGRGLAFSGRLQFRLNPGLLGRIHRRLGAVRR